MIEGDEKRWGKCMFFSPIGKKYSYFYPNWLKLCKITKKRFDIFRLRRAPRHYHKFSLGKKYKSRREAKIWIVLVRFWKLDAWSRWSSWIVGGSTDRRRRRWTPPRSPPTGQRRSTTKHPRNTFYFPSGFGFDIISFLKFFILQGGVPKEGR